MSRRRNLQVVTSNGKVVEGTCYHRTRHLPRVETLRLDGMEQLCLRLLRHVCETLASGTAEGTESAHRHAESALGEEDGSALVSNITALLHAIRAERQEAFSFMTAECPICSDYLCEEEQAFLELLRAARKSDPAVAVDRARNLVGEGMVVCVVLAASALASQLDALAGAANRQRPFRVPG